jgi:hypothetical protein
MVSTARSLEAWNDGTGLRLYMTRLGDEKEDMERAGNSESCRNLKIRPRCKTTGYSLFEQLIVIH